MMSYFAVEMTPGRYGGGFFEGKARFRLGNIKSDFSDVDIKFDTGCSVSTIPVKTIGISSLVCKKLKEKDIDDNTETIRSYGVETGGRFHSEPITKRQKMNCPALKFKHTISDFEIEGVQIPISDIYLNYDRTGNVLIGMDILNQMINHIDISQKTGHMLWLCAPRDSVGQDFYDAMAEHFGIVYLDDL